MCTTCTARLLEDRLSVRLLDARRAGGSTLPAPLPASAAPVTE
ncbi:hypothetical protein P8A22_26980 [Streptomyces laculatispora]|uniref:Uncharacterized protein n=1 Tax=Streptomyces laculatispora TaxID=887464 RepID=A0ABY9I8N4_9ACTN|nr:hypothetical protein [Streptomyces laculatispora]WLQ43238.1 hypothetical protein P8A22_26980 [Streptomyces laculatispora]